MKIFILVDMEGISGICRRSQVTKGSGDWQEGRRFMTGDTNACVRACREAGASEVVVRDVHATTDNLMWEALDEGATYIMGNAQAGRMPGIENFDGVILLGYHAMAGTRAAVLEHTASSARWQNLWINGEKAGEIAVDAAIAGDAGVPVIMVSGDDHACHEATAVLGNVTTVQVKQGLALEGARLLPPVAARSLIEQGTRDAIRNIAGYKPHRIKKPVTLRLELVSREEAPVNRPGVTPIDGRTFEITADTMQEAVWKIEA